MTNKQKRIAFRGIHYLCWATAIIIAWASSNRLVIAGFVLGAVAVLMAVGEVAVKQDAKAQAEAEAVRVLVTRPKDAAAGIKPKPPGLEYIRDGFDPVERP